MALITAAAVGITAVVTGISSYFMFRPSENHHNLATNMTAETAASIQNDVIVQEQPNLIGIITVLLLIILIVFKIIELSSIGIGAYKRAMKKKYSKRQLLPVIATQSTILPTTTATGTATAQIE